MQLTSAWLSRFSCLLLLASCSPEQTQRFEFVALGTIVSVTTFNADQDSATAAAGALEKHLNQRAVDWYAYADGELAAINAALLSGDSIDVSPPLAALLRRAGQLHTQSGGTFHAGLGTLMRLWGLHDLAQSVSAPPPDDAIQAALSQLDSPSDLRWKGNQLQSANLQFDLGGIAKGALLAECSSILAAHAVQDAIVSLGGDLLVTGQPAGRAARIGIRSPFAAEPLGGLTVASGEAVMTSGNYERFREFDGVRYTHILDPQDGKPVRDAASATVIHNDPALADAAATALLVGGPIRFDELTRSLDIEFAMLVSQSGDVRLTPGLRKRLNLSLELSR